MNRTKVILSIFLMLFLLLAGLVLPSFWKSQKKEASGNKGREPAKETTEILDELKGKIYLNIWILML
jgi:CHASE3 domain sensor protein